MALEKVGVRATIEGLSAFENGMRKMDRSVEQYGKAAMTASKRTEILTGALKKVGLGLTAASAASGALLFSSVKLAARVETLGVVTKVLGKNVGLTEKEIRDLEKAIQDQGITIRASRQALALMIQSNIDLKKSTELAALAQNAAVLAGVNSSEAFERLITIISTGNVIMARRLNLQVNFNQSLQDTAKQLGKTVAELTPLEKIQARTNEVFRAGVNIAGAYDAAMGTVGKSVTSVDRLIEDSQVTLGDVWLPTYNKVVGFVSDSLKTWLAMDQTQKDVISTTLGFVTAVTGLLGALALVGAVIPKIIGGLTSLGTALGVTGTFVFSTAAVMGIVAVSIVAVGAAIVALFHAVERGRKGVEAINAAFEEHEKDVRRTAGSYEIYRAEVIRAGLVVAKTRMDQRRFNATLAAGGEEAVLARAGIELLTQSQFESGREIERTALRMGRQVDTLEDLEEELTDAEKAAKKLEKQEARLRRETERLSREQERLGDQLSKLKLTIRTDITLQLEEFQAEVKKTETRMSELRAEIRKNEREGLDTSAQRRQLENLQESLAETREAWDRTTKNLIFNLAEQRLAIGGLTEEELRALTKLAGPEGLGLIDEAAVALLAKIDALAFGLGAAGDQSAAFAEDVAGLQVPMRNMAVEASILARAIRDIQGKEVTIGTNFVYRVFSGPAGPTTPTIAAAVLASAISPEMLNVMLRRQAGGFLQAGQRALIGERGPEAFVPRQSGMVLNNRFVGAINSLMIALKSAPAIMSAPMTPSVSNATTTNNFSMNINTRAPIEPIISDFRTMQSIANAL